MYNETLVLIILFYLILFASVVSLAIVIVYIAQGGTLRHPEDDKTKR